MGRRDSGRSDSGGCSAPSEGLHRRRVLLRITAAGVRLREAKSVLDPVRVEQVLGQLSPADRDKALEGLELLASASERQMKSEVGAEARS